MDIIPISPLNKFDGLIFRSVFKYLRLSDLACLDTATSEKNLRTEIHETMRGLRIPSLKQVSPFNPWALKQRLRVTEVFI